jgi:dihydrofolate reductase
VIYYVAASLDGYIARADGSLDWLEQGAVDYGFHPFMASVDAVVMGRATFDHVVNYGSWPYGDVPGWVLSGSGADPVFEQVTVTDAAPVEVLRAVRGAGRSKVWLVGGGRTVRAFLEASAVDRLAIYTIPILLGDGIPMFPAGFPESRWRPVGARVFENGVIENVLDRVADDA